MILAGLICDSGRVRRGTTVTAVSKSLADRVKPLERIMRGDDIVRYTPSRYTPT
jgi:hypothetical protein